MTPARARRYAIPAAVLVVVVLGAVWALAHRASAENPPAAKVTPAVPVTSTLVREQDVPLYRTGVGTVVAAMSVTVKPRIDGQLDKVAFTEGQDVREGQLLVQIDPRTLQAQLLQAKAQKDKDEAQLVNARADLARYLMLIGEDAATQQQVDTQKALVAQLEAAIKTDAAQINFAEVQLTYTTITAPISGRVGARLVDPGNIVHAADPGGLLVINQIDPISVVFTLPEDVVQQINAAQRASRTPLTVVAYPRIGENPIATGRLILLNNQIDTSTGTVQLKARFANPDHQLWPGQYVNARLMLGRRSRAITVPAAVVQRSQDGTFAYVVDSDKTVRTQPVVVAQIQDGMAVIDKGLAAGERVVVDGQFKIKPGIKVVETSGAAQAPAAPPAEASK
ncbi:MAG TPA: efflux RND transporter periplasmic adaptor subunit [Burkholderiaceae bacterium]|nr:efflux RND transporter periplasmic adaptor subunit [Burkholderiaceae bacterium]